MIKQLDHFVLTKEQEPLVQLSLFMLEIRIGI